jgi:hypothetical protein
MADAAAAAMDSGEEEELASDVGEDQEDPEGFVDDSEPEDEDNEVPLDPAAI